MFKLCSSAAPGQAHIQTTLAEIANSWKEKLAQPEQATPLQAFEPPVHEPEDQRHEAKMRQVHLEGAGRLWAAIRAGTLADRLTADGLLALTATCPDGTLPSPATETMRKRLEAIVSTGFLTPGEDGLFDRAAVAAALPHLNAPDDAAVRLWLVAGSAVGRVPVEVGGRGARSSGLGAVAIRKEVKTATTILNAGQLDWSTIHLSILAEWLEANIPGLRGKNPTSLNRTYLAGEGLAPADCQKGRARNDDRTTETARLNVAFKRGHQVLSDQNRPTAISTPQAVSN